MTRLDLDKATAAVDAWLPLIFLALGLPMVLFFAFAVPPFEVPDEYAHLLRADQLSYGDLVGIRLDAAHSGGWVESSYRRLAEVYGQGALAAGKMPQAAAALALTGEREFATFPNTVQYGPFMYAPQALALGLGRASGLNALQAFYLARCLNGLASLALGFLALRLARRGRYLIYFMLSMPMALFLMGSLSQDALLISGSALFLALVSRTVSANRLPGLSTNVALVALLAALAWGRPPYLILGVVFLLQPFAGMRRGEKVWPRWSGLAALACAVALTAAWSLVVLQVHANLLPAVSAPDQARFLLGRLELIPRIAAATLQARGTAFAAGGLFGSIGIYDSGLPGFFYLLALSGMVAALAIEAAVDWPLQAIDRALIALALASGAVVIYLALYLIWTPVGRLVIEGMQGRYLIPFVLASAFVLPVAAPRFRRALFYLVWCLPLVPLLGCVVSVQMVLSRYH